MLVTVHTLFSVLALLSGLVVFFLPKGTMRHKQIGYTYVVSMFALIITSFWIFDLFAGFGVFHAMSIVSLVTLIIALYFPLFGRSGELWFIAHYIWMGYSYVGLVMAAGSHLFEYFPDWSPWLRMVLFWGLPYVGGTIMIFSNKKKLTESVSARMRQT
ncbi:MAG: DUF2306 domain-containing protein [Bacteroidota bacterium]